MSWLDAREPDHGQYSIGELRERLCRMSAESWRLCYVHLREGCHNCSHVRRPTQAEWDAEVLRWPLGDSERRSIGCYEWSLHQYQQATERRERDNVRRSASRCERSRSRSPSRHGTATIEWRRSIRTAGTRPLNLAGASGIVRASMIRRRVIAAIGRELDSVVAFIVGRGIVLTLCFDRTRGTLARTAS